MLVQRLDRLDSFYYIVPFETRQKAVAAAASVDARFGNYRQAVALPEGGAGIIKTPSTEAVRELVMDTRLQLEEPLGRIKIPEGGVLPVSDIGVEAVPGNHSLLTRFTCLR